MLNVDASTKLYRTMSVSESKSIYYINNITVCYFNNLSFASMRQNSLTISSCGANFKNVKGSISKEMNNDIDVNLHTFALCP